MKTLFENFQNIEEIKSSNLVIFLSEEGVQTFLNSIKICKCEHEQCPIQQSIQEFDFKGKYFETSIVGSRIGNFNKLILVGLGKEDEFNKIKAEEIGFKTFKYLNLNKFKEISFLFNIMIETGGNIKYSPDFTSGSTISLYSSLIFGFSMAEYNFNKYFTGDKLKTKVNKIEEVTFITKNVKELKSFHDENEIIKENVFFCRDLINEPANIVYPESCAKICKEMEKFGVKVEMLKEKDLKKLGMESMLAVGQGSDQESYLVVLKWNGDSKSKDAPLAFVGKGVTFDSGGLSLKLGNGMDNMKCDMSGSAVVAGLIRLLAMRKAKVNAIGILSLVENVPSGNSMKVGDVVKSMSGQTIEIMNTDAEGRMILADAIYYAVSKFNPKIVIDLATLTGAICVALGEKYAGLFTNNDNLAIELRQAGEEVGETLWRMPLSELGGFYDKQIDSDFADVRNTGKTRDGGAITAAQFLQRFTNKHPKWAHLDIAATAYLEQEGFLTRKYGSGFGVRLLNELIKDNYEK
ncbi:MAG: leucyl aminopeptidase [Rickettsiales bacterium]|nr:leucyl aminopeptidase [Rickettsiales bacterium]